MNTRRSLLGGLLGVGAAGLVAPRAVAASRLQTVSTAGMPRRILDTRIELGYKGAKPQAGQVLRISPKDPITGKSALFLNVTVTETDGGGFLTVYPLGQPVPGTSNVNWSLAGTILSNMALVECSSLGEFNVYVAVSPTHIVIDAMGGQTVL